MLPSPLPLPLLPTLPREGDGSPKTSPMGGTSGPLLDGEDLPLGEDEEGLDRCRTVRMRGGLLSQPPSQGRPCARVGSCPSSIGVERLFGFTTDDSSSPEDEAWFVNICRMTSLEPLEPPRADFSLPFVGGPRARPAFDGNGLGLPLLDGGGNGSERAAADLIDMI